jgi:hypothetical protein
MHRMNRDERIGLPASNIVKGWQAGGKREETRIRSFALSILTCFDWDGATPLPTYDVAVDIMKWANPTI